MSGPIRALVGGLGHPWLRDLDFGTQFVRRVGPLAWPDDVAIEDVSYAAHRVLHLLQEIQPQQVILICAFPREEAAGTIRRYRLDLNPPDDLEVQERLGEAVGGVIDLDHTLAVIRYWKALPDNTTIIEIEPGDQSFGLGFSEQVEAAVEPVFNMVREELGLPPLPAGTVPSVSGVPESRWAGNTGGL